MNYTEVTFQCNPDTEIIKDILIELLGEAGFESFLEENSNVTGYIPENIFSEEILQDTIKKIPFEAEITYKFQFIPEQNWNEEWEKNFFRPIIIENKCAIHSSFHQNIPPVQYDIIIDPKMSFGTGHHETTGLMIDYLIQSDLENKSLLDMGCGTAVLAILAKKKGANPVIAIDIDKWAYENSLENVKLNHTEEIEIRLGGVDKLKDEKFDIILANINRNILLKDINQYTLRMKKGSKLYMSGFYSEDIPRITDECLKHELRFISYIEKNNWAAVKFVK